MSHFAAGLNQHVVIEPGERGYSRTVSQQPVPGDAFVHHGDIGDGLVGLQARRKSGRPHAVRIGRGHGAVSDQIPQRDDSCRVGGSHDVDRRDPVVGRRGGGLRDRGLGRKVALTRNIGRVQTERMRGEGASRQREIETHRQIGQRREFQIHQIGDHSVDWDHPEGLASADRYGAIAGGHDGRFLVPQGDVRGSDLDRNSVGYG
jgi:hypothetical protein